MKTAEKSPTEIWAEDMRKTNKKFAMIRTDKAIYDRVAIIKDLPTILIVQFPKSQSKNKNSKSGHGRSFRIVQENIPKRDICGRVRYYKD